MSSKKKELTLQEIFYNLCKDLIRYIDKKIVRKYVSPNPAQIPKDKRLIEKKYNDNKWRYFFEDEETTEEEKIKDIFKDNNFLSNLQILNKDLNVIVTNMEENKTNQENLDKKIQMKNKQLKIFGEINHQLVKYFMEQNKNFNCINQNDIIKALEELKNSNIININSDTIQLYINNMNNNKNLNDKNNKETEESIIKPSNNKINNNNSKLKENNININEKKNNQNIPKTKVIPKLIQAFDILNKNKNMKIKEEEKNKLMKKIFESDSSESNDKNKEDENNEDGDDEEEEEEKEEEEEIEENNKNINKYKNKSKENEKEYKLLNKKVKRNNQ